METKTIESNSRDAFAQVKFPSIHARYVLYIPFHVHFNYLLCPPWNPAPTHQMMTLSRCDNASIKCWLAGCWFWWCMRHDRHTRETDIWKLPSGFYDTYIVITPLVALSFNYITINIQNMSIIIVSGRAALCLTYLQCSIFYSLPSSHHMAI